MDLRRVSWRPSLAEEEDLRIEEKGDELIHAVAASILRRGLAAPATVLLEVLKPFGFALSQLLLLADPLLSPFAPGVGRRYAGLLEDRRSIDRLQAALENPHSPPVHPEGEGG